MPPTVRVPIEVRHCLYGLLPTLRRPLVVTSKRAGLRLSRCSSTDREDRLIVCANWKSTLLDTLFDPSRRRITEAQYPAVLYSYLPFCVHLQMRSSVCLKFLQECNGVLSTAGLTKISL